MANPKNQKLQWTLEDAYNDDFTNYATLKETRLDNRENKAFAYPGPYSRNIAGTNINQKMKRGFMRSIIMDKEISSAFNTKSPGNLRLNFQFNPEYIERNVQQSVGAVNPLLQNPANLTQAVPGTASFNFTMLFNREAEVAQRRKNLILGVERFQGTADRGSVQISEISASNINDSLKDPGQVGVMHDLSIFDSIIGQGITEELIDVISAYTAQQTVVQNNEIEEGEEDERTVFDKTKFEESVTKNFGNSAFLNPMPVRIVFSDLFMVEGLIVGSAVAFQKFSQDMIPTMCQINCNVTALYVGFAKRKAFLTDNLTSWAKIEANKNKEDQAETAKETKQLQESLHKINVGINVGSKEEEKVTVPFFNTIGQKTFTPTSTGLYLENASIYYAGNSSSAGTRFVTFPQWFNAFAASSNTPGIMKNSAGAFVGTSVLQSFGSKEKLPVSLYLTTTDAAFNTVSCSITARITDASTNQNKETVVTGDGVWNKIPDGGEMGFLHENTSGKLKLYVFKTTFFIDPVNVTNVKQTINPTSRCTIALNITFQKTLSNGSTATYSTTLIVPYNGTDPFFYDVASGVNSNFDLVKNKVFGLKRPTKIG